MGRTSKMALVPGGGNAPGADEHLHGKDVRPARRFRCWSADSEKRAEIGAPFDAGGAPLVRAA